MKNFKKILPLLIMTVCMATSMTSCLSDSDSDDVLTPEQEKLYRANISGTYFGKTYFYNRGNKKNSTYFYNDSISSMALRQNSADSTIILESFPAKLLFKVLKTTKDYTEAQLNNLSDSEKEKLARNQAIIDAAEDKENIDMKFKYMLRPTPVNNVLTYYVSPFTVEMNLEYQGEKHDIAVAFMSLTPAQWSNNSNVVVFMETAIYDGKIRNSKTGKEEYQLLDGEALYNDQLTTTEQSELMFEFYGKKF